MSSNFNSKRESLTVVAVLFSAVEVLGCDRDEEQKAAAQDPPPDVEIHGGPVRMMRRALSKKKKVAGSLHFSKEEKGLLARANVALEKSAGGGDLREGQEASLAMQSQALVAVSSRLLYPKLPWSWA